MQGQMLVAANSTPINVKQIFFDKMLCPHILDDIVALNFSEKLFHFSVSVQGCSIHDDVA